MLRWQLFAGGDVMWLDVEMALFAGGDVMFLDVEMAVVRWWRCYVA